MIKTLIKIHCSYRNIYALVIPYTYKHPDFLSFRTRQRNRTGHPSKTLGFSQSKKLNKLIYKYRNLSCAIHLLALPSALNCNGSNSNTKVINTKKQHCHHPYHQHCSMVWNVNNNRKKHNHFWYDDSTRGAESSQEWNIQRNVRYIQVLCSSWQRRQKSYIQNSPTKEVHIPYGLG